MMRRTALCALLFAPALFAAQTTQPVPAPTQPAPAGAPLLTFTEVPTGAQPRTIDPAKPAAVDINSRVNIAIDQAALAAAIPKALKLPNVDQQLIDRIHFVSTAVSAREQSLQQLKQAFSAALMSPPTTVADRNAYFSAVSEAAKPAGQLINAPAAESAFFNQRRRFYFTNPPAGLDPAHNALDQYSVIFLAAADEVSQLRSDLNTYAAQNGVYVQLGAWVQDRPVHLEGFDAYPVGDHFVVERFNINLSDEQKAELANIAAVSKKLNADGASALTLWRELGSTLIENAASTSPTAQCIRSLQQQFEADKTKITGSASSLQNEYFAAKGDIDTYVKSLDALKTKYAAGGITGAVPADQFLIGTNEDVTKLIGDTQSLIATLQKAESTMRSIAAQLQGDAKTSVTGLASSAAACAQTAGSEVDSWRKSILGSIHALSSGSSFDRSVLDFGTEVTKLAAADVPSTTFIPLTYTGQRQRGDALTVKLAAGTPTTSRVVLSEADFVLYQTLPYITTKVGLIFANPRSANTTDDASGTSTTQTSVRHFQTAPAYSVLLKKDSPTNMLWNTVIDPGVGINVSALDFNHDDTPELGVGLVGSVFRDIVQVGYGYNVPLGKWYAFFGLRLPMPSLTLSGGAKADTAPSNP